MSRAGWVQIPGTHEFSYKGRSYRNMARFERPCATCGENFPIFVTQKVADGGASSNNFGMKNCEKHRLRRVQHDGRDLGAPAHITGFARVTVENGKYITEQAAPGTLAEELERLRTANVTMKAELDNLYPVHKETFEKLQVVEAENVALKARLAQYELPAALAQQNKMPWS